MKFSPWSQVRKSGVKHHFAKLTPAAVEEIRSSREPLAELAKRFGVTVATLKDARYGKTWK